MPEFFYFMLIMLIAVILFTMLLLFVLSKDWKKLEELYRANYPAPSNLKRFEYGSVGIANYNGSLCIGVTQQGLYLSIVPIFNFGLKPILIPWNAIQKIESTGIPFFKKASLTLSSPSIKIIIKKGIILSAKQYLPAYISNWE
jgi:hypothetical protein